PQTFRESCLMQHRTVGLRAAALIALAALVGACGGGGGVGGDLGKVKGGGGTNALGQATTTAPPTTAAVAAHVTTAPKTSVMTARAEQPAAVYTIQSDTKGQYIEPLSLSVTAGALVRFTNSDTIAHQITGKLND